ncbi:hypothetical protein GCM10025867_46790 (plasmid) [Frondihabitans sucicola]|uniref:TrbL/VirB6 plasmid conjugal transfer protein n=1 Tax=Frondihabitans sucicola TaxID=1268041 RepID=A0ABN6Y5I8_9MICO|nr:type IV secretion system protein [Frondihabitans sucicola]BDZ52438.1 hypothetical protein GCM10025867_46790 [Frondihabitans sucicola]
MTILALNRRMTPKPIMPTPALVDTARKAFDAKQAERRDVRAKSPVRRLVRRLMMALSGLFLIVAFVGGAGVGSAQAFQMPWDTGANIAAGVLNFCNPEAVPDPSGIQGFDSVWLGLNKQDSSKVANAVKASDPDTGSGKSGLARLQTMFKDSSNKSQLTNILNTGYSDYGMSTLRWTNYGASCMSEGSLLTGVSNLLLTALVVFPSSFAMAVVSFAMNNILYTVFSAMVSPVIGLFAGIFKPWLVVIAVMIGLPFAWIKSRGSLGKLLSATAWVAFILSIFFYVQNNSAGVFNFANNAVTNLTSFASCMMLNSSNGTSATGTDFSSIGTASGGGCNTDIVSQVLHGTQASGATFTEATGVSQAIWYSLPYTVWSMGEVGPDQAAQDRLIESNNGPEGTTISWSAAILNGQYAGPGDARIVQAVNLWNNGNYNPSKAPDAGSKISYWTNSQNANDWKDAASPALAAPSHEVPFLSVVRALCNDTYTGTTGGDYSLGDSDPTHSDANKWGYGSSCDTATAKTSHVWTTVQGNAFEQRISAAVAGGLVALIILAVLGFVSMYLIFQKLSFYFLMMFAPLFLAIGAFPDEKRSAFAKKYGEVLLANVIKQVVAVIMVIFIAKSLSTVLSNASIPWLLKPLSVLAFYFALLFFAIPLTRILKAAAKGDTKVIDKVANAPKTALKVAAVAGAVAATAGIAAPVLAGSGALAGVGGLGGLAKGGLTALKAPGAAQRLLGTATRGLSRRGGVLGASARAMSMGTQLVGGAFASASAEVNNNGIGVKAMDAADLARRKLLTSRGASDEELAAAGLYGRNADGSLTEGGKQQALADWMRYKGSNTYDENKAVTEEKRKFFKDYRQRVGKYHEGDPDHPSNAEQASEEWKAEREEERRKDREADEKRKAERGEDRDKDREAAGGPSFGGGGDRSNRPSSDAPFSDNNTETAERAAARAVGDVSNRPGFASTDNDWTFRTASEVERQFGGRSQAADAIIEDSGARIVETYGANAARIDVTHPAGAAVAQQIWANASGDEEIMVVAASELADHVRAYGTPAVVVSPSSVLPVADFDREGLGNLVAALPSVRESDSMDERFRTALAFSQVASTVPSDHPMFGVVDKARDAVLNPFASPADVNHISGIVGSGINDYQAMIADIARQAAAEAAASTAASMATAAASVAGSAAAVSAAAAGAAAADTASAAWARDAERTRPSWADEQPSERHRGDFELPAPRTVAPSPAPAPAPSPSGTGGLWGVGANKSGADTEKIVDAVKEAMRDQKQESVEAVADSASRAIADAGPDVDEAGDFRPGKRRRARRAERNSIFNPDGGND